MKQLFAILFLLISNYSFSQTAELRGSVSDYSTRNGIPHSIIKIYSNGVLIQETLTDSSGNYRVSFDTSGIVVVSCEAAYYWKQVKKEVHIDFDKISFVLFSLKAIKD